MIKQRWHWAIALLLVGGADCAISQSAEASVEQLSEKASVVVVGTVMGLQSEWSSDRSRIITRVSISVNEFLKGGGGSNMLTLSVLGGEVDGVGELYTHTAAFKKDEEVVVFAERDMQGNLRVTGGDQGKVVITRDPRTGRRIIGSNQPVETLTTLVKAVVRATEDK